METVQHEAEPEKLVEQESVTGEQATLRLADTTQGETMVGGAKEAVEDEGGEGEMEERDEVVEEGMEEGEGVRAPVQEVGGEPTNQETAVQWPYHLLLSYSTNGKDSNSM